MQDLDHRLHLHAPAQDRQLHAGDDGLPDALLPRRSLLGRPPRQGSRRRRRRRRQPDVHRARRLADARRRHDHARVARRRAAQRGARAAGLQPVAGAVDAGRACCSWWSSMAFRTAVRRTRSAPTRRPPRARPTTCSSSCRRWACSSAWSAMGAALRGVGNFKPGMVVQTAHRHHQHRARADPDLRLGHGRGRWAWPARRSPRSSRWWSASRGSRPTSSAARAICASSGAT